MRFHLVLNGCAGDIGRQSRELTGFAQRAGLDFEKGNTIIICDGKRDGDGKMKLAEMAPTTSVIFIVTACYNPEIILKAMQKLEDRRELYLFGSNYAAQELSVRLGCRTGGSSLQNCLNLQLEEERICAKKMVYSNHMAGTFQMERKPVCISIAKGQEEAAEISVSTHEIYENAAAASDGEPVITERIVTPTEQENSLEDAPFVIVGGRGIRRKEAAQELAETAEKLHAAAGFSRPVVMNAWMPMDKLVGVSGAMLKPQICITAALSGAPALYAGIEKSKFIAAINTDERASIIKKADVCILGDYREVLEELAACIKEKSDG